MAIKRTSHRALTLRGNEVSDGIEVQNNIVPFSPRWGMVRHSTDLLATTPESELQQVYVALTDNGVVVVSAQDEPARELVLVQEFETGSGAKRWPGFHVEFGDEVRVLSKASTSGGSGYETWTLISAPLGWAQNIATQFIDERDYGSQTISYNADIDEDSTDNAMTDAFKRAGLI